MEVADGLLLLMKISDPQTDNARKDQLSEELIRRFWTAGSEGNLEARRIVEKVFDLQADRLAEMRRSSPS